MSLRSPKRSASRRTRSPMAYEPSIRRYRIWYRKLLRLHSNAFHERFGEGMEQTFNDLLRERAAEERGLMGCALWMFVETSAGILREKLASIMMQSITKRMSVWAIIVAGVLMIPLAGKAPWTAGDFVFGAVVLFGSALVYELVASKGGTLAYRGAVALACGTGLLLVWINGAVGIIGDGPVNLMYLGVLAVGFVGAIVARFEPRGMSRALFATALAMVLVPVIALIIGTRGFAPGVATVLGLNAFFALLFGGSAVLFRRAGAAGSQQLGPLE